MASVNRMIRDENDRNKQQINFNEAIKDLKDGSYDKMMVGGKADASCNGGPCPVAKAEEKALEKACGSGGPCPVEKTVEKPSCGSGGPCPAEKPCGADKPCPA